MPAVQLASAIVETAINRLLATQPQTNTVLDKLRGKRLTVFLDILHQGVTLVFDDSVMVLTSTESFDQACEAVDATTCIIKTKAAVLPELSKTSHLTALIQQGDLQLIGDIAIAQQVSELINISQIDLEELVARNTSDVFAHSLFGMFGSIHKKATSVLSALSIQGGELITEERPIAARRQAVSGFAQQVSTLRNDVDRLSAKIDRYEKNLLAKDDKQ